MKTLLAALLLATASLASAQETTVDRDALGKRMNAMTAKDWRPGVAFGDTLADLPSPIGFEILRDYWKGGASVEARQQMFKGFVFNGHPDTVRVLHLGATDPDLNMQNWAFTYLKDIAFTNFAEDYRSYAPWYAKYGNMPLKQIVRENAARFIREARSGSPEERAKKLENFPSVTIKVDGVNLPEALDLAKEILTSPNATQAEARSVSVLLKLAKPDEAYFRAYVVPAMRSKNRALAGAAIGAMGKAPGAWVTDELLTALRDAVAVPGRVDSLGFELGMALGERKDPRSIPTVIAAIAAHNAYDSIYGLGYFALSPLTGVDYQGTHDGAWWKDWWSKNRERMPEEIRNQDLPTLTVASKADADKEVPDDEDVADIPGTEILGGGSRDMRAFLAGPVGPVPTNGYRLLVVMPGGDGSAAFFPFLKRVVKNSLPQDTLLVQLVAKKWSEDENRVVWPHAKLNPQKATFLTEEFVSKGIDGVAKKHKIDRKQVYACGWSSGGPAVWATLLQKNSPFQGAFVAMSVFHPQYVPPVENAKGKRVFILHSPEDFIPIKMAETARDQLRQAGATVEYATYEGGHGWHGDVFRYFREATIFLRKG